MCSKNIKVNKSPQPFQLTLIHSKRRRDIAIKQNVFPIEKVKLGLKRCVCVLRMFFIVCIYDALISWGLSDQGGLPLPG